MGDEDERRAAVALQGEEEVDDRAAGGLVEIAGRLVGDEDGRVRHDRAGDGDALLLAARKLRRVVVQALAEADRPSSCSARAKASSSPASSSGSATFSSAVMVGTRWKDWKTMPMRRPRKRASASSSSADKVRPVDDDAAGIRPLEPGHHHEQRRLAGPGRPDEADRLAAADRRGRCS